jgi:hypothetical protein
MSADPRTEMIREEDRGWAELCALLESLSPAELEHPGLTEEWSVKDLLGHLASWWAETAHVLEQLRLGTYERRKIDVDEMNRRFQDACRDLDLKTVRSELWSSRNRALEELGRLPQVNDVAREWFVESGAEHYQEHLPDLRRFVDEMTRSRQ